MACSRLPSGWKPGGRLPQRGVVTGLGHAQGAQAGPGDQGVAPAVRAQQAERAHPVRVRVVAGVHPLHPRAEQRHPLPEQAAVAVGHGQVRAWLGAHRQLVPVVVLHALVPGQVIGVQRGHRDDRRRAAQIGGLVAGGLDHPVVVILASLGRFPRRLADVPADHAPVAPPGEQVARDRRGAALALGPGDAQHPVPGSFLEPQAQPAHDRDAARLQLPQVVAVAADARRLDHHARRRPGRPGRRRRWRLPGGHPPRRPAGGRRPGPARGPGR